LGCEPLAFGAGSGEQRLNLEAVWNLYRPWRGLMLQIDLPLLVLGTPAMFFFERGSTPRWLISTFTLWGWALVLLAVALYFILQILQDAFTTLPGT